MLKLFVFSEGSEGGEHGKWCRLVIAEEGDFLGAKRMALNAGRDLLYKDEMPRRQAFDKEFPVVTVYDIDTAGAIFNIQDGNLASYVYASKERKRRAGR